MSVRRHVLIVEDEEKIRSLLQDYLEAAGFSVACLERGDEVIPSVRRTPPDIILLDIMLPGMDGDGGMPGHPDLFAGSYSNDYVTGGGDRPGPRTGVGRG